MMLIDDIKKQGCQSEASVDIDGIKHSGWVCAKPINPRMWRTRIKDALQILKGKAIAVQYFDDLNDDQKYKYITKNIRL